MISIAEIKALANLTEEERKIFLQDLPGGGAVYLIHPLKSVEMKVFPKRKHGT